jgi:hypothetical protein
MNEEPVQERTVHANGRFNLNLQPRTLATLDALAARWGVTRTAAVAMCVNIVSREWDVRGNEAPPEK